MDRSTAKLLGKQSVIYLLLLLTGAVGALLGYRFLVPNSENLAASPPVIEPLLPPVESQQSNSEIEQTAPRPSTPTNFIAAAVEKVGPAVVRIDADRVVQQRNSRFYRQFPEDFFGLQPPGGQIEQGTGSGFILREDGQILTNAHVVEGADTVRVLLKDGRSFQGEVLGTDSISDVAVIKIEATALPTVTLGNSETLQSGEWAIAIGNPLGLDNSVTAGIISATGRSSQDIGVPDKRIGFIQTDAAINPGNSGGPLLNAAGEVIGMNTAIISGAQGLGFAIPINSAQQIAQQLITTGKAEHPYWGIEMVTLTPEVKAEIAQSSRSSEIIAEEGVLIVRVVPGSPADVAGLRSGDVIQKINNQEVQKSETVQSIVQSSAVGSELQVEIQRTEQRLNLTIKTGNLPVAPN